MNSGLVRRGLWFFGLTVVLAIGVEAQEKTGTATAVGAAQASAKLNGEGVMNLSCLGCHEIRNIQTQALDKDGWTKTVQSMIEKGAKVAPTDLPVLVDYLTKEYGPVPDGAGKAILLDVCTQCHSLDRVRHHEVTKEKWDETLSAMLNEGAPLSDEQYPVILNYLARNFRPAQRQR